jgi:hypothetical protein
MKIVKRVSLLKSLHRLNEPNQASFKIDRMIWNKDKPYRLTTEQELFRFGYKNYKNKAIFVAASVLAYFLGVYLELFQRTLLDVLFR